MKKTTIFIISCVFYINLIEAQILEYNFNNTPYLSASTINPDITASELAISSGSIDTDQTTGTYFTDEPYIGESGGWAATTVESAKYFSLTINAKSGKLFSLSNISFDAYATSAGPSAISILINDIAIDTANLGDVTLININKAITGYSDKSELTIKIACWDNGSRVTSGSGIFRMDNIIISGSISDIPPNDSTSSFVLIPGSVPSSLSSITGHTTGVNILDIVVSDSASGDNVNTQIDEIIFIAGANNQINDWSLVLDSVLINRNNINSSIKGEIKPNSLVFNTVGAIDVEEGINNQDTIELFIWLNDSLPSADNKIFEFYTDSSLIKCNSLGSIINHGSISSGANNLTIRITASEIQPFLSPTNIYSDSVFSITCMASDANGNIDTDYNENIDITAVSNSGELIKPADLTASFSNGVAQLTDLIFNGTDTVVFNIDAPGLNSFQTQTTSIGKYIFADDFEDNTLNNWTNIDDWIVSNDEAISGSYSLKHNLNDTSASSFIASKYTNPYFNNGRTIWNIELKNGNFDPTSTNKFWYYLMASSDSLTQENIAGYIVGINFSGSTDTLSLWRKDADGTKELLVNSEFEWNENASVNIEIIRDVPGFWQIGFSTPDSSLNTYSSSKMDSSYSEFNNHGLVFNYSTTRAGLLWCDNINCIQMNTAPIILSAQPINQTQIAINFSENILETEATNLANYILNSDIDSNITIDSVIYNANNPNKAILFVNQLITAEYAISVSNIKDFDDLTMKPESITFSYSVPAKPFNIVINEIMADPTPAQYLPEGDYIELFNSSEFEISLNNWELYLGTTKKQLPDVNIKPDSFLIICQNDYYNDFVPFGKTIELLSSSNLTISDRSIVLKNTAGIIIDSVLYKKEWHNNEDKENGGWSLERIDPLNTCSRSFNWASSINDNGGTPGEENSVFAPNLDILAPEFIFIEAINANSIRIEFSEELDSNIIGTINFSLSGFSITSLNYSNLATIVINIAPAMNFNTSYRLSWANIVDLCGNSTSNEANFQYNRIDENDVSISELMIDPSPTIGLPEYEYIEITNISDKTLNIENWILEVNGNQKRLPRQFLDQNEVVILCSESGAEELSAFGKTIGISGVRSLPNSGAFIQLLDTAKNIINSVSYSVTWYNNDEKQDGGWSLEKIDLHNACSGSENWSASKNPNGGTPGIKNSINGNNMDNLQPRIIALAPISDNQIWINFSESISETGLNKIANFYLLGNNQATSIVYDTVTLKNITLSYNTQFDTKSSYTMRITNLFDKCHNTLNDTNIQFIYNKPEYYQLVINEIMANPEPSIGLPEAEYIELYNNSANDIYMYNWYIKVGQSERLIPYTLFPKNSYLLLCKPEFTDTLNKYGQTISIENLPALPSSGEISIVNNQQKTLCISSYSQSWINDDFKADGGYSLERIDFNNPSESNNNWQVSNSLTGGTPGQENSIHTQNPDSEVFNLLKVVPKSDTIILATFNKALKTQKPDTILLSLTPAGIRIQTITLIDPFNNTLEIKLSNALLANTLYTLTVDQKLSDLSGNLLNYYNDDFMLAENALPNDIIINEVLFNPLSNGVDFVEIYNRSSKPINVSQFLLATLDEKYSIKTPYHIVPEGDIILAGEYRVLSENSWVVKEQYKVENEMAFIDMEKVPTFSNESGSVVLIDTSGFTIDIFTYNDDMHFALLDDTKGISLERISFDQKTQDENNWHSASENSGWATPGYKNSVFKDNPLYNSPIIVDPEAFSPDNDGYNDFVNFYYEFNDPGFVANIKIFNKNGVMVRNLVNNELLAQSGVIVWDGLTDKKDKALIGIYVVLFEIFDLEGNVKSYKKTCVVAAKM